MADGTTKIHPRIDPVSHVSRAGADSVILSGPYGLGPRVFRGPAGYGCGSLQLSSSRSPSLFNHGLDRSKFFLAIWVLANPPSPVGVKSSAFRPMARQKSLNPASAFSRSRLQVPGEEGSSEHEHTGQHDAEAEEARVARVADPRRDSACAQKKSQGNGHGDRNVSCP